MQRQSIHRALEVRGAGVNVDAVQEGARPVWQRGRDQEQAGHQGAPPERRHGHRQGAD